MGKIGFHARWREELVASSDEGIIIFELAMGTLHVYFPDEACWAVRAPAWAKDKWAEYKAGAEEWCRENNNVPLSLVGNALVFEEKRSP